MLRLSEHYVSIQGEGSRVGTLTQFVRFAGCNMRCPGWPCDTQHAIDPNIWRHESERIDNPYDLANRIHDKAKETGAYNICLTGGEPFLQPHNLLFQVIDTLAHPSRIFTFEVFTNGSFLFPGWTKDPLVDMLFTMDWKLVGSGEANTALENRELNVRRLNADDTIKFVINTPDDFKYATGTARRLKREGFKGTFSIGVAWNSSLTTKDVVDFMMDNKLSEWKLNVQIHKYIWPADERGV